MTVQLTYGYTGSALVYAASDRKHRPASHPLLRQVEPVASPEPLTGARIRALRERRGMSQGAMAGWLGVSRVSVTLWEGNKTRPSPEHEAALRRLLCA